MTRVCIVSASQRANSQSRRIAEVFRDKFLDGQADILDLHETVLPLFAGPDSANEAVAQVREQMAAADAFIFVAPEWHGMAPAALKNLLLWCGAAELAHKPTLLTAVSASAGGAFVIAELRGSGYKNSRLLWLPEHLILRDVTDLWAGQEGRRSDEYLEKRARYAIDMLLTYSQALSGVRESLLAGLSDFGNGMS